MTDQPTPHSRTTWRVVVLLAARWLLGGVFIYMSLEKIYDPVDFMKLIREYQMVPDRLWWTLNLMAVALPWVEFLCGLLLISGVALRGTALLLFTMLVGFTIVVAMRALDIYHAGGIAFCDIKFDCGCGAGEELICHKLPENTGLIILSLIVLFSRARTRWLCLQGPRT